MDLNRKNLLKSIFIAVTSSLITAVFLMLILPSYVLQNQPQKINYQTVEQPKQNNLAIDPMNQPLNNDTLDITTIASRVIPSVVGISSSAVQPRNIFKSSQQETWSVGSGVIVSADGYILTNHHVIGSNQDEIIVTLDDGETLNATKQWADSTLDLAVIKVDAKGLQPAILGDASGLRVGERAVAIGNPLGLQFQRTVTAGIVSAINRTISVSSDGIENYMEGLIQTDASINPGNSGGPLINNKGEVIGINTIKVVSAEGMGFAIPINIAKPVIARFVRDGNYVTPYMGLFAYDTAVAEYINQDSKIKNGIYVTEIDSESPAYKAGIRIGDIITHMGGVEINTMMALREEMFKCGQGSACTIRFIRNGEVREVSFELGARTRDGVVTR